MHFSVTGREAKSMARSVRSVRGEQLSLRFVPGDHYRYAIVLSKKHGTAPQRNRTKRILREIMRLRKNQHPGGSYLVYVNRSCAALDSTQFVSELENLIPRAFANASS